MGTCKGVFTMTIGDFTKMLKSLPKNWVITMDGREITGLIVKNNCISINYNLKRDTSYCFDESHEEKQEQPF